MSGIARMGSYIPIWTILVSVKDCIYIVFDDLNHQIV